MGTGLISKLERQERRLREGIVKAPEAQKSKAVRRYLHSGAAHYVAANQAAAKMSKKKYRRTPSKDEIEACAANMNVWEPCNETVWLKLQPKEKHGVHQCRFLLRYGYQNIAQQTLVRNALEATGGLHPDQTLMKVGRDGAIKRIIENYKAGYDHVFEMDIKSCFQSFCMEKAADILSMPEEVVAKVLTGRNLKVELHPSIKPFWEAHSELPDTPATAYELFCMQPSGWREAQQGLSEGNSASSLACEKLLAPVLYNLSDGAWRIVNYADNFFCCCWDAQAAQTVFHELRELLHQHPAGPLHTGHIFPQTDPSQVIFALGYALVPDKHGNLRVELGDVAREKLRRLRARAYRVIRNPELHYLKKLRVVQEVERKHRNITGGYALCAGTLHQNKMAKIKKKLKAQAKPAKELKNA